MAEKVYAPQRASDANILRIVVGIISMLILVALVFLLVITGGSTAAWWGFAAVGFAIFVIAVVIIDKIK